MEVVFFVSYPPPPLAVTVPYLPTFQGICDSDAMAFNGYDAVTVVIKLHTLTSYTLYHGGSLIP